MAIWEKNVFYYILYNSINTEKIGEKFHNLTVKNTFVSNSLKTKGNEEQCHEGNIFVTCKITVLKSIIHQNYS